MGRRRALLALLGAIGVLAATTAAVISGDGDGARTQVAVGSSTGTTGAAAVAVAEPSTTTPTTSAPASAPPTAAPRPTTTRVAAPTTTLAPEVRRRLLTDPAGAWVLDAIDDDRTSCVEFIRTGGSAHRALCGAPPADGLVGDVASFRTGERAGAVVAVVAPEVTGFGYLHTMHASYDLDGEAAPDPLRPGYAYSVYAPSTGGGAPTWMFLFDGQHVLGRVTMPPTEGTIRRADLAVTTGSPYGRWPGYRFASYTGLIWGGHQELGFYDGPNGETCVLYRRLGDGDRVFYDACPAAAPGGGIAAATLAWDGPRSLGYQPVLVVDGPVTAWRCEEARCGLSRALLLPDPKGTGRSAGVLFASAGPSEVVLVALDGDREIGRVAASATR